ncbi:integral membrane protein dgcr2 idd [Pitangus sulphuratus]|nr:integral membrane protein dgcr2 idd [Pitangus sulphuratus]
MLLAHVQLVTDQHPQVVFHWASFQLLFLQPVVMHGVAVMQGQDLALHLVEPFTVDPEQFIQSVQIPLQNLPTLQQINTPIQLGVICKLTEGALNCLDQTTDKDIKENISTIGTNGT